MDLFFLGGFEEMTLKARHLVVREEVKTCNKAIL